MIINSRVTHKKYGIGTITDFSVDTKDMLNSRIIVNFDSGHEAKFALNSLKKGGFLKTDDDSINEFIKELELKKIEEDKEKNKITEKKTKYRKKNKIPFYRFDEFGNTVSIDAWKKACEDIGFYRFQDESRAVLNDEFIFINASTAIKAVGGDIDNYSKIYRACDLKSSYLNYKWSYATKENIENIIEEIERENDTE